MKKILFIGCVLWAGMVCAQETDSLQMESKAVIRPNLLAEMPGVEVLQDSAVSILLQEAMNGKGEMVEIDGFRVQIYSSNRQQTAKVEALELEQKMKEVLAQPTYVQYLPPFWKVRIGDFRTYDEAKEYKKVFIQQFPQMMGDTYIVRDKIQVLQ